MRKIVTCLLAVCAGGAAADHAPPRVTVNLDLPPDQRWVALLTQYNDTIHAALQRLLEDEPAMKYLFDAADLLFRNASNAVYLPPEHREEVASISKVTGFPVGMLLVLNAMYDWSASGTIDNRACTSIVAQPPGAAPPIHGRNLDYPFRAAMEHLAATADFQRGGKTVYTAVTYLGTVNFNTVVVPGGWSLSHDERDQGFIGTNWVDMLLRRRVATFSRIRLLAESVTSYDALVASLRSSKLDAPSYFVVAGAQPGEGAIVTRGRDSTDVDVFPLNASAGRWYVVETNYDHWVSPAHGDDRRHPAERALGEIGPSQIDPTTLMSVLSDTRCNTTEGQRSVLNSDTVYTSVMQPSSGKATTVMRTDDVPGCVH
jgi:hypothetical protein